MKCVLVYNGLEDQGGITSPGEEVVRVVGARAGDDETRLDEDRS